MCDSKSLYRITRELAGVQSSKQHLVKRKDGALLISDEDQLRRWKEYFALDHVFESNMQLTSSELPDVTNPRLRTEPPVRKRYVPP